MKYCKYCGKELKENVNFCQECGNPVNSNQQVNNNIQSQNKTSNTQTNVFSIIGFVISLSNFLTCGFTSIFSLILSIIGLVQINKTNEKGKGLAIAGIVISVIFILLWVAVVLIALFASNNPTIVTDYA